MNQFDYKGVLTEIVLAVRLKNWLSDSTRVASNFRKVFSFSISFQCFLPDSETVTAKEDSAKVLQTESMLQEDLDTQKTEYAPPVSDIKLLNLIFCA